MAESYRHDEVAGGCRAKDVHDEMRKDEIELPGEEKPTKEWMKPQSGSDIGKE